MSAADDNSPTPKMGKLTFPDYGTGHVDAAAQVFLLVRYSLS